jgi:hypothetical protein
MTQDDKSASGSQTDNATLKPQESPPEVPSAATRSTPPLGTESPANPQTSQNAWNSSETANAPQDRSQLLARARAFLVSPQVRLEDDATKRRFLADKGLTDIDINTLLCELVRYLFILRCSSCRTFHTFSL